jgi:nucleoside-diphosphate-sugar epimerase
VLVTGASGFLGRNLLLALPRDWEVLAIWHSTPIEEFCTRHRLTHVKPVRADLAAGDLDGVGDLDACVALAANGDPARSLAEPRMDLGANALSLLTVLERVRTGRLVFLSSGAVYDGLRGAVGPATPVAPTLPYAVSKLAAERYLAHFVREGRVGAGVALRFFGAYGPFEPERKIYTRLVRRFAIERKASFRITGDGRNLIDAMYVDDAVRGILAVLEDPPVSPGFAVADFAAGSPITIRSLVEQAAAAFGLVAEIEAAGAVPEYIEFHSADDTVARRYGVSPRVELADGLRRLANHLGAARG